jgi:hypothetical protein
VWGCRVEQAQLVLKNQKQQQMAEAKFRQKVITANKALKGAALGIRIPIDKIPADIAVLLRWNGGHNALKFQGTCLLLNHFKIILYYYLPSILQLM